MARTLRCIHSIILTTAKCLQCITADCKALTRVCVIDYAAYDQFTKPPSPITDYLTWCVSQVMVMCAFFFVLYITPAFSFSGITAEALESITTTLADVQAHLCMLIMPLTILVGHSLESDLRALQLSHPWCIDTALIFHHPRRRPLKPGLAWLTRKWLGRTIQDRGPGGHDPEEDARACVDLLKAKIKNGPGYGEFKTDPGAVAHSQSHSPSRGAGIVGRAGPGLGTGRRMPTRCPSLVHSCPTPSLALTSHSTLLHTCLTTPLNADILDSALAFAYTPPLTVPIHAPQYRHPCPYPSP